MTKIISKDSEGRIQEVELQTVDFEILFKALNESKIKGSEIVLEKIKKIYNWEYDEEEG